MIYQFKVSLKGMKPPIWRRLRVDGNMTFSDVHRVLQVAFEWHDEQLHSFVMLRSNGMKMDEEIGTKEEEFNLFSFREAHDEKEETVANWFSAEKDRALYTYNFKMDWEHELLLEKIIAHDEHTCYPHCVKAMRYVPGEYGSRLYDEDDEEPDWRELTQEINERLMAMEIDDDDQQAPEEEAFDWKDLLAEAHSLNIQKPWRQLEDGQVFAISDPLSRQLLYCCVLGAAGQEFGLALYIGEEGLDVLKATIDGTLGEDFIMKQRSVLLSFADRDELDADDLAFLKQHGASYRGRKQWIQMRSFKPGYYPWLLDEEEGRMLLLAIQQTKGILTQVQDGLMIPLYEGGDEMIGRIAEETASGLSWETVLFKHRPRSKPAPSKLHVSELDLMRVKRMGTRHVTMQFGTFMLGSPIREKSDQRPYFPLMAIAMDDQNDIAIQQKIMKPEEQEIDVQTTFLKALEQLQGIPKTVTTTSEVAELLAPLTDQLPIKVRTQKKLHAIEQFRDFISKIPW